MPFDPTTATAFNSATATPVTAGSPAASTPSPQAQQAAQQQQHVQESSPQSLLQSAGDMLFTALHGAADTATFGLADKASAGLATGISALTGQPQTYDESLAKIRANNAAMAGRNPVSAVAGDVAGTMIGAGKLAQAAKMIPGVGALAAAAEPVAGSPISNVLKSAAVGGAASGAYTAADDAIRTGSIDPNNVALNAVTGAVVGPAVSKIGTMLAKGVQNSSTRAMTLLASKIGETPDVLQNAFDNFSAATGRVPTMAELVQMKSQGELKALAGKNPIIQQGINDAADTADAQRPAALSQIVENNGGPAQDVATLARARSARMTAAMDPIRNDMVPIDSTQNGLLTDQRTRAAVRDTQDPDLRVRVNQAIDDSDNGGQGSLSTQDLDSIRQSLNSTRNNLANTQSGQGNSVAAQTLGNHIANITDLVTGGDPTHPYAQALDQFANDSNYIRGFKHGNAGKSIGQADNQQLQSALNTAEGQAGHQAGIVSRTSDAAASSPQGAQRTAAQLAAGTGDSAVLRGAVGQQGFSNIQAAASAENQGATALNNLAGRIAPEEPGVKLGQIAQAGAGAMTHSPAALVYHISKVMPGVSQKLPPAVQTQVARYLTNPQMTQQGINLLRRAGATDDQLRKLSVALSANAGLNTADTLGQ